MLSVNVDRAAGGQFKTHQEARDIIVHDPWTRPCLLSLLALMALFAREATGFLSVTMIWCLVNMMWVLAWFDLIVGRSPLPHSNGGTWLACVHACWVKSSYACRRNFQSVLRPHWRINPWESTSCCTRQCSWSRSLGHWIHKEWHWPHPEASQR